MATGCGCRPRSTACCCPRTGCGCPVADFICHRLDSGLSSADLRNGLSLVAGILHDSSARDSERMLSAVVPSPAWEPICPDRDESTLRYMRPKDEAFGFEAATRVGFLAARGRRCVGCHICKTESRSWSKHKYWGASFSEKALRSWCAVQAAVGCAVTAVEPPVSGRDDFQVQRYP
jgi:hypothetical protein